MSILLSWKTIEDVPRAEGYKVSNMGDIRSKRYPMKNMSLHSNKENPYDFIRLTSGGRIYVHEIVAKLFIPNPNNYSKICHNDGDFKNNMITNLSWIPSDSDLKEDEEFSNEEVWKPISMIEFKDSYQVSNYGQVKSNKTGKNIKIHEYKNGSQYTVLKNYEQTNHLVSNLVAGAFVSNMNNYKFVKHIDNNFRNNNYKNLTWCEFKENKKAVNILEKIKKENLKDNESDKNEDESSSEESEEDEESEDESSSEDEEENEEWKTLKQEGFENKYQISTYGNLRNKSSKKILVLKELKNGLKFYASFKDYGREYIHYTVARHFIDNPNEYEYVSHLNGDVRDNKKSNLIWTEKEELTSDKLKESKKEETIRLIKEQKELKKKQEKEEREKEKERLNEEKKRLNEEKEVEKKEIKKNIEREKKLEKEKNEEKKKQNKRNFRVQLNLMKENVINESIQKNNENWKILQKDGFDNIYEVSDKGNIRNFKTKNHLTFNKLASGLLYVRLFNKIYRREYPHILVATHFIENPNNYEYVYHINEDITDNTKENLIWTKEEEEETGIKKIQKVIEYSEDSENSSEEEFKENEEVWRSVKQKGFEQYIVSNFGNCKGIQKNLKVFKNKSGQNYVRFLNDQKNPICFHLDLLVAQCFLKNPNKLTYINHINGDADDNNSINLEWTSKSVIDKRHDNVFKELEDEEKRKLEIKNKFKLENPDEIWKPITDFPDYEISNLGRIWSNYKCELLALSNYNKGYKYVQLWKDNISTRRTVHDLVGCHFLPEKIEGTYMVNHIDGNPENNTSENLEWTNHELNSRHAAKTGLLGRRIVQISENNYKTYFSVKLCSEELGISEHKLRKLINTGTIYNGSKFMFESEKKTIYIEDEGKEDIKWKEIEGFPYMINTIGQILNEQNKQKAVTKGKYYMVNLTDYDGNRKTCSIHILVAKAFIPNPNNYPIVNHIDNDRYNNRISNLEWCTQKENLEHASKNNRLFKRKIEQYDIDENLLGKFNSIVEAAKITGINKSSIANCCRGDRKIACEYIWKYADEKEMKKLKDKLEKTSDSDDSNEFSESNLSEEDE
jgi:hypothetical protein